MFRVALNIDNLIELQVIHAESPTPSKILVGSFAQPVSHAKDGLLVLDSREIDPLTGILTLCAMLEVNNRS